MIKLKGGREKLWTKNLAVIKCSERLLFGIIMNINISAKLQTKKNYQTNSRGKLNSEDSRMIRKAYRYSDIETICNVF